MKATNYFYLPQLIPYSEDARVLAGYVQKKPNPHQSRILHYMKNSLVFAANAEYLHDAFTGESIDAENVLMTDGEYRWDSGLIYYIEKYNFKIPKEFIDRVMEVKRS